MNVFAVVFIVAIILFIWFMLSNRMFKEEQEEYEGFMYNRPYIPRTKTNWNMIALIINIIEYFNERGFEINKDIKEVEKEIETLEKQKKKLEHYENLRSRRDKLFGEVNQKSNN